MMTIMMKMTTTTPMNDVTMSPTIDVITAGRKSLDSRMSILVIYGHIDREAERQTNRHTGRQTYTHTATQKHTGTEECMGKYNFL